MKPITKQTYALFWQNARNYKRVLFLMVVTTIGTTALHLLVPLYYKKFLDVLASSGFEVSDELIASLTSIILFIFALHAISWVLYRVSFFSIVHFQTKTIADIANTAFAYIHQHSYRFFINRFVGALVRKVNRLINSFEGIVDRFYYDLFPLALRIIGVLIILFYRHTVLGSILFVWIIVYITLNYFFTAYKLKYDEESAKVDTEVTARLADTITNNTNVKLFSGFSFELGQFRDITEKQRKITKFSWDLNGYMEALQAGFMIILEFLLFYFAIRYWARGILTVGDFILIQAYLLDIFGKLWDFGRFFRDIYRHLADAEEMVEILNTPHEIQDKPGAKELVVQNGEIEFSNISFTYTKTREVIRNFNLRIIRGEKIGLVGPSGAGKSTLFALLLRFYDLQEGAISIDSQNIADVTQESLRRHIAMVPQDPILFHRSLMENIRYGRRDAADEEVFEAARLAHCDEFIEKLPQGYNTFVGERGIKLSGGERQRVAIARAILKNAPILLLDEATSSLDSHSEAMIQDALTTLMEGKTVLVIAHRLSTIMKMDRIVVVREGEIVEIGTHQELVEKEEGLYKGLWELQAGGFIG